jgi:hypothetical protein
MLIQAKLFSGVKKNIYMSLLEILRKDKFLWFFAKKFYVLPKNYWYIEFCDNSDEFWEFIGWKKSGSYYEEPVNRSEYNFNYKYVTNFKEYTKGKKEYGSSSYLYSYEKNKMSCISFSRFKRAIKLKKLEEKEKKEQKTETK